ncbi:unnamed protein product [Ectocarpus fasciculatus]
MTAITMSSAAEWRLFPPPLKPVPLSVGDEVFVRTKSAKEVGKKGTVCAFEKVEATSVVAPAATSEPAEVSRGDHDPERSNNCCLAEPPDGATGAHSRTSSCDVAGTTTWRNVDKQEKKPKKGKKFEDKRAVIRLPPRAGGSSNPPDYRARPSRLVRIYGSPPVGRSTDAPAAPPLLILLTADTASFRLLAASQVRPCDTVLEVGCSTGETTAILAKYVPKGRVVALDVGADMVERTKERLKLVSSESETCADVAVHKMDPFLDPRRAVEAAEHETEAGIGKDGGGDSRPTKGGGVDAVFIDIGGNRELRGVVRMIDFARTAFAQPPRLIVVKSQELVAGLKAGSNAAGNIGNDGATTPAATASEAGSYAECGRIAEGDLWFRELLARSTLARPSCNEKTEGGGDASSGCSNRTTPKHFHPNKAPLRLSPSDGVTPICRYYNYHPEGCRKGGRCPFDHAVCHWCLRPGHVALSCENANGFSVPR